MIETIGLVTVVGIAALATLLPLIVFLDRRAAHRTAAVLAVTAVVLICVVLAGVTVLVIADTREARA